MRGDESPTHFRFDFDLEHARCEFHAACACAGPASRLREMAPGQVLEVRVNDPTARLDIEAWCQLSGNPLLAMTEEAPDVLRFFVRKK